LEQSGSRTNPIAHDSFVEKSEAVRGRQVECRRWRDHQRGEQCGRCANRAIVVAGTVVIGFGGVSGVVIGIHNCLDAGSRREILGVDVAEGHPELEYQRRKS
jgi:hypothetical protein